MSLTPFENIDYLKSLEENTLTLLSYDAGHSTLLFDVHNEKNGSIGRLELGYVFFISAKISFYVKSIEVGNNDDQFSVRKYLTDLQTKYFHSPFDEMGFNLEHSLITFHSISDKFLIWAREARIFWLADDLISKDIFVATPLYIEDNSLLSTVLNELLHPNSNDLSARVDLQ